MDNDKEVVCKMFVGGLSWDTTIDGLRGYFCRFGEIIDCVVMTNEQGRSRGFGFVTFKDSSVVQVVCAGGPHRIDNRVVDPKPCNPRGGPGKGGGKVGGRGRGYPKIFVGGLPTALNEEELKQFFQDNYGDVFEVVIMYDQERRKSRGFGFVSFENDDAVDRACKDHYISINGKQIECKRAQPRDVLENKIGGMGGGGPRNDFGGYGYGAPGPRGPGGPGGPPGADYRNGGGYGGGGWGAPGPQDGGYNQGGWGAPAQQGPPAGPPVAQWGNQAPQPAAGGYQGYGAPAAPGPAPAYGGYGAAGGYGAPGGPAPGGPPAGAYSGYGAPGGPVGGPAAPNGYNMGGGYGQDQSSYGPTRGGYEGYNSQYSAPAAPGTERTNGAPPMPAGTYHPYRR